MPEDARSIANFFIEAASTHRIKLSHLQLQKILFFAHAWHLAKYNEPLIGQNFEAWQYGPVVRVVYEQLKIFKNQPITAFLTKINAESGEFVEARTNISDEKRIFLSNLFNYYSQFHAFKLVDLTHEQDGPWEKAWKTAGDGAVPGMLISNESIRLWILREGGRGASLVN